MKSLRHMRSLPRPLLWLLAASLRLWSRTLRWRVDDPGGWSQRARPGPMIVVLWHNRVLFAPMMLGAEVRSRMRALASQSRDGGYIAQVLLALGLGVVRGSTSRGGARALVLLKDELAVGNWVVITPDGPRGPRYRLHEGAAWLAARTGAPVLCASVNCANFWSLRSWDRTQVPKPFSRVTLVLAPPLSPPPPGDRAALEAWRGLLEARLRELSEVTEADLPVAPRPAADPPGA